MVQHDGHSAIEQLLELGIASIDAASLGDIAAVLTSLAAPMVGAANAAIGVLAPSGSAVRVFQGPTATAGNSPIRLVDLAEPTPLTDAVRTGHAVLITSEAEFGVRYPRIAGRTQVGEVTAMSAYPLKLNHETLGACFFRFAHDAEVGERHYELMEQTLPLIVRAVARIQDRNSLVLHTQRLEQSNRDLDNFAAVVSHDLSAPVRRIGSYFQLLLREVDGGLSPKATRFAQIIRDQITHLDALLRDTLAYAQVVAPTDTRQPVQLAEVVQHVLDPMHAEMSAIGAEVTIGDLPVLDVEASLFQQVFQNLFDNAIKYRSPDRQLRIQISAEPGERTDHDHRQWWTVRFADNGIGIDPGRVDEVFAMFARLEVSEDRPGTGVGLAFVKRVIERHAGEVGIEPGLDGGTAICLTVPGIASPDVL